jgi:Golgi nucleoside diphosphatase
MNPVSFTTKYVDKWKKHTTLHPGIKENSTYKPSRGIDHLYRVSPKTKYCKGLLTKTQDKNCKESKTSIAGFHQRKHCEELLTKTPEVMRNTREHGCPLQRKTC